MLLYNIESIARKLTADYESVSSHIEHMGVRGSTREDVLRNHIKSLLPQKYYVGNGIITDSNGAQSKQQDFFIYDAFNSPTFLQTESTSIIPIESVFATIEVKSSLNKEILSQCVDNIKSVKSLELATLKNSPFIPSVHNTIFGAVFSYTSTTSLETLATNLSEFNKSIAHEHQINIVCVLDKGLILHTSKAFGEESSILPSPQTTLAIIENEKEKNLYLFYLLLLQHLNTTYNFPPNLMKYAVKSGALNETQVKVPMHLIPDDLTLKMGGATLNKSDIEFFSKYNKIVFKAMTNQLTAEDLKDVSLSIDNLQPIIERFTSILHRSFGADVKATPIFEPQSSD